jgi:aminoglycoside 3-N-acetyltransferase
MLPSITRQQIADGLARLGIEPGAVLLVHSSLKSLGQVDGGPATVIAAIEDVLGPSGTLVMPALTWNSVNASQPRFDVRRTPGCVGLIPETFRLQELVIRSLHPTHSLVARGARAAELMSGHERCHSPGPVGSPYHKIVQAGGLILFIGTGIGCNTMLHCVEEWAGVTESLEPVAQPLEVVDYDGNVLSVPQHRHKGDRSRFYAKMRDFFATNGVLTTGRVGQARCELIDAAAMTRLMLPILRRHRDLFTHDGTGMLFE